MDESVLREALQSYSILHRGVGMLESKFILPLGKSFHEVMTLHSGGLLLCQWQHHDTANNNLTGFINGMVKYMDIHGQNNKTCGPYESLEEFQRIHPRCFQKYIA